MSSFPADPLNIELTVRSRSAAWLLMRRQPQAWWASADVIGPCEESVRHVGDVSMWTVTHDSWESIHPELVDTVLTADGQQFEPELDEFIGRGPRNVLLVERWTWSTPWRTMAGPLLAATIARFAWQVRLAVCHATSDDDARSSRDLRAAAGAVLEQHGWHPWRGLHIADPRSDAIADTALEILEAWMPTPTPD
ncbi:hypothetical protein DY240_29045 [Jiangella rhizosphaerae]|uniref:Uncharacterized protein n=1 Tax=Jiangella rhizosphaerae TaxID=2293569 RepID=A0A418KH18_9ACTN|nr:hypothetical protein DY240_29045 [Jiangella rhizosphaerae]